MGEKMKIGYIRVSTEEQNTDRQEDLMKQLDVEKIYIDKESGASKKRKALQEMLNFAREGDTVVVESISRFSRNTKDLLELIEILSNKKVKFISQKEHINTETATGKFMLTVFGAVAELERDYIKARQKEGIESARIRGIHLGRPKLQLDEKLFSNLVIQWQEGKLTAKEVYTRLNISNVSFYKILRDRKIKKEKGDERSKF